MLLARDQNPVGGLGWGQAGKETKAESTGDQRVPRQETRWHPPRGLRTREARQGARRLVPGLQGDASSPKDRKPVLWELGSQGWVFRVFCNYFPFVLP